MRSTRDLQSSRQKHRASALLVSGARSYPDVANNTQIVAKSDNPGQLIAVWEREQCQNARRAAARAEVKQSTDHEPRFAPPLATPRAEPSGPPICGNCSTPVENEHNEYCRQCQTGMLAMECPETNQLPDEDHGADQTHTNSLAIMAQVVKKSGQSHAAIQKRELKGSRLTAPVTSTSRSGPDRSSPGKTPSSPPAVTPSTPRDGWANRGPSLTTLWSPTTRRPRRPSRRGKRRTRRSPAWSA